MSLAPSLVRYLVRSAVELAESDSRAIELDVAQCVHGRNKFATCDRCLQACRFDAISLDDLAETKVSLDPEQCAQCGLCLQVCPVGAIRGADGFEELVSIFSHYEHRRSVELVCAAHPSPELGPSDDQLVVRTTGCLAATGPAALISLVALGAEKVSMRLDVCSECPLGAVVPGIERNVALANTLFSQDHRELPIRAVDRQEQNWVHRTVMSAGRPPRTRREFFRSLTTPAQKPPFVELLLHSRASAGEKEPPKERRRLLLGLHGLPEALLSKSSLESFPAHMLAVAETCTACGLCASVCPTGALSFNVLEDDAFELGFRADYCTECGLCLDFCEPEALSWAGHATVPDWLSTPDLTLWYGKLTYCRKCGAGFSSNSTDLERGGLCPICSFREQNPFGSRLPPGFEKQRRAQRDRIDPPVSTGL